MGMMCRVVPMHVVQDAYTPSLICSVEVNEKDRITGLLVHIYLIG